MFSWLGTQSALRRKAIELYGMVVTQARQPALYRGWGVPDTPEGRYEMVALHLALVLARLQREDVQGQDVARHLAETFVTDMDDCLRELGVGDLAVPKTVRRATAGLYERTQRYAEAVSHGDKGTLGAALSSYIPGLEARAENVTALADYVLSAARHLEALSGAAIMEGHSMFPSSPEPT